MSHIMSHLRGVLMRLVRRCSILAGPGINAPLGPRTALREVTYYKTKFL